MKPLSWLLSALLFACAGEDVVLFTVQSGGRASQGGAAQGGTAQGGIAQGGAGGTTQSGASQGGASQGGASQGGVEQTGGTSAGFAGDSQSGGAASTCRSNTDCNAGFCEKTRCGDDVGHCELRDVFCEGQRAQPVCGCDNVTYLNDCWRRQAGVPLKTFGECRDQMLTCSRSVDCPNGALCVRLFAQGDACLMGGPGKCWSAPESCEAIPNAPNFMECGTPGPCVDMCTAIRSTGHSFTRVPGGCPQP